MGRAIVCNPKVFLMDEPLSNLDAKLRGQMRVEIASLYHKLNSTFIYVTHDQTEAMTLGTRIVVMKDGVVQQVDTPERLFRYPANQFVAGFIGTPPMNFAEAVVKYDPTVFSLLAYLICHCSFSRAVTKLNLGIAYAIWCSVGILVTAAISRVLFGERVSPAGNVGMALILVGCIVMNLSGSR